MENKTPLVLKIVTPSGDGGTFGCDSIKLNVRDNLSGKHGGLYGIHRGAPSEIYALEKGRAQAFLKGEKVLDCILGDGFATVKDDVITAAVESFEKN